MMVYDLGWSKTIEETGSRTGKSKTCRAAERQSHHPMPLFFCWRYDSLDGGPVFG